MIKNLGLTAGIVTGAALVGALNTTPVFAEKQGIFEIKDGVLISVKKIGHGAFKYKNTGLLSQVKLPDSIESIEAFAFSRCKNLKEITLPKNITKLEQSTFWGCSNLETINTSSKLEEFGLEAVHDTKWLENLRDSNGFAIYNGILIDGKNKSEHIKIPDGVKEIGIGAFKYSPNYIASVTIPDSVTLIRELAFYTQGDITSVKMGNGAKKIEDNAFGLCTNLKDLTLSNSLEEIGRDAFLGCDALKEVAIPSTIKKIGMNAFSKNCKLVGSGDNFENVIKEMNGEYGDNFDIRDHLGRYEPGWIEVLWIDGNYYKCYNTKDYTLQMGWMDLDGKRYYFYNNGWMATEFVKLGNNVHYYFDPSTGELQLGWKSINGKWYYFNPSASGNREKGYMQTSWLNNNGKWYYFYSDGRMATGFINLNGTYYYLDASNTSNVGSMKTGWQKINGYWYYFNQKGDGGIEGAMKKGWNKINGKWYYFNPSDGKMAANTWIDGYYINANGEWK